MATKDVIIQLALNPEIKDKALTELLYEICDNVHAHCGNECPVYFLNGNKAPDTAQDFKINRGCDCFKSGSEMLKFIREHA